MHQDGRREITKNMAALQISADRLNMTLNMELAASKLLRYFIESVMILLLQISEKAMIR
jgi:hypothetical protein